MPILLPTHTRKHGLRDTQDYNYWKQTPQTDRCTSKHANTLEGGENNRVGVVRRGMMCCPNTHALMDASRKNFTRLVQWPLLHYYNTTTDAAAGGDGAREAFGRSRSGGSLDSLIPELSLEAVPQTRLSVVVRGWEK